MRLTQIKASSKGFTLVELIVVITILAILGTIAFISFGSQSSAARDSKRKTDLSSLASKINVAMANGSKAVDLIADSVNKLSTGSLAGTGIITLASTDYNAGTINGNALGININDFKDPVANVGYRMGATNLVGGVFQLASNVENDDSGNPITNGVIFVGNYAQRTIANTSGTGTVTTSTNDTVKLNSSSVGVFKVNDFVLINGTKTMKVSSVSSDLTTLTLVGTTSLTSGTAYSISIAADSVTSLISKAATPLTPAANLSAQPY